MNTKRTILLAAALVVGLTAQSQPLVNLGLVGVGRLPSESFDLLGPFVDTLGGTFSAMAMDLSTLARNGETYEARLYGLPDRGFGDGLQDYHTRLQTYRFAIRPYYGPYPVAAQDQISFTNVGTALWSWGDNFYFTGANADDTNSTSRPQSLPSGVGGGKWSMDCEGLAVARDGSFYVGDEYGPFIYQFNSSAQLIQTLVPPPAFIPRVGTNFPRTINYGAILVATNDSGRFENRGFEGLTLTPDGRRLVAMTQTAFAQDGASKAGGRNTRILVFDVEPGSPNFNQPVGEYIYQLTLNGNEAKNRSTPISEIIALNDHQFLVIERDSRGRGGDPGPILYKKVVLADLNGASNIIATGYDLEKGDAGQISLPRTTLPTNLVAVTRTELVDFADAAQLAKFGLNTQTNWDANTLSEKWEGLAILPLNDPAAPSDYLLLIGNDNDFKASLVYHNGVIVGTNAVSVDTMMLAFRIGEDRTPPTLTCPSSIAVPAGPNCSLPNISSFVTTTDNSAAPVQLTQNPPVGAPLGLGTVTVTVVATDAAGNSSAPCSFPVTITDPPPTLICPKMITAPASTNCQALVPDLLAGTNVIASHNCRAPISLTQTPPAGTLLGVGINSITVVATTGATNSTTCTIAFVVASTTAPTLVCPGSVVLGAGDSCITVVPDLRGRVTASGACGSPVTITQTPTNGTILPPGKYDLIFTATDAAGNRSVCTNTLTVADLTPPTLACPANVTLDASKPSGAMVSYTTPAASGFCETGSVAVACAPPSGSTFPTGTNVVICAAAAASSNRASCAFTITVRGSRPIKRDVLALLTAWRPRVTDKEERRDLDDAIKALADSLQPEYWLDDQHLNPCRGKKAFDKEADAVKEMSKMIKNSSKHQDCTIIPVAVLQGYIDRVVLADRLLAVVAINEAIAQRGDQREIAEARKALADGDKQVAKGDYDHAIEEYRHAWDDALDAIK